MVELKESVVGKGSPISGSKHSFLQWCK